MATTTITTYTAEDPFGDTLSLARVHRNGRHAWLGRVGTGYTDWDVHPTRNVALADSDEPHFWSATCWSNGMPFRQVDHVLGGPVCALAAVMALSGSAGLVAALAGALRAEADRILARRLEFYR